MRLVKVFYFFSYFWKWKKMRRIRWVNLFLWRKKKTFFTTKKLLLGDEVKLIERNWMKKLKKIKGATGSFEVKLKVNLLRIRLINGWSSIKNGHLWYFDIGKTENQSYDQKKNIWSEKSVNKNWRWHMVFKVLWIHLSLTGGSGIL